LHTQALLQLAVEPLLFEFFPFLFLFSRTQFSPYPCLLSRAVQAFMAFPGGARMREVVSKSAAVKAQRLAALALSYAHVRAVFVAATSARVKVLRAASSVAPSAFFHPVRCLA